jgi:uncharacterized protein
MIRHPLLSVLAGLMLLTGCVQPSPDVVFHTLSPIAPENVKPSMEKPLALEILPVQLPELLQRPQIVFLKGTDTHGLSATHRWGNTLEKDMQRVLAENLSTLLGSDPVVLYPDGNRVKAVYRITLEVQQCDGEPGGLLQFRGTWMITSPDGARVVLLRKSSIQEPVTGRDIEALVSAHSRILATLSREIAAGLKALN